MRLFESVLIFFLGGCLFCFPNPNTTSFCCCQGNSALEGRGESQEDSNGTQGKQTWKKEPSSETLAGKPYF